MIRFLRLRGPRERGENAEGLPSFPAGRSKNGRKVIDPENQDLDGNRIENTRKATAALNYYYYLYSESRVFRKSSAVDRRRRRRRLFTHATNARAHRARNVGRRRRRRVARRRRGVGVAVEKGGIGRGARVKNGMEGVL